MNYLLTFLKFLYFKFGIHTAPRGTISFSVHHFFKRILKKKNIANQKPEDRLFVSERWKNLKKSTIQRIAIIKGDHLGDLILAIPSMVALKKSFPKASLTLICIRETATVARNLELFDEIIVAPLDSEARTGPTAEELEISRNLLGSLPLFDLAVDLKVESTTRFALDFISSRFKAGFYSEQMPQRDSIILPPVSSCMEKSKESNLHTSEFLKLLIQSIVNRFNFEEDEKAYEILRNKNFAYPLKQASPGDQKLKIGISTGAGNDIKMWPIQKYASLCEKILQNHNAEIFLFGTKMDLKDAEFILKSCENKSNSIQNLVEKISVSEFIGAIGQLDLMIGNDSGPCHISASIKIPTICIFSGFNIPSKWQPRGSNVVVIQNVQTCTPCGLRWRSECNFRHACMAEISVDAVLEKVSQMLTGSITSLHNFKSV